MKKIAWCTIILMLFITVSGCGRKKGTKIQDKDLANEFANAPQWVLGASADQGLAAVGSSQKSKAGVQHTRTMALANARDELARMMNVKVKNMVKNFTENTGIGDDETVDKVSTNVSKQVASQVITGSRQKDVWISPSGEIYVLVTLDSEMAAQAVKNSMMTSYKNEKSLWQKFQAQKAQEELDEEIEKEFGEFK
ncbi:MAG: LPP20 family lipoprotein [bacterium]